MCLRIAEGFPWMLKYICVAFRDLVPFAQFKKREKRPWRSVTFSKVAGWSVTKSRSASQNSLQAQTFPQDLNTFSIVQEHSVDLMQIYKQCQYVN